MAKFIDNFRATQPAWQKTSPLSNALKNSLPVRRNSSTESSQKVPLTNEQLKALIDSDNVKRYSKAQDYSAAAAKGTLQLDPGLGFSSSFVTDGRFTNTITPDVYKNYDALNNIIDKYDEAETIQEKMDVIKNGWTKANASNWTSPTDWFEAFAGWTETAADKNDDTRKVSKLMRQITEAAKTKYGPQKI